MVTLTKAFAAALAGVERPGDFCTAGVVEIPAPGLIVDGVGRIALPLLPAQAAALVAAATAAPFGRGEATVVDRDVRRTWQIDPAKVRIAGRHWPACLDRIVAQAAAGLGVDAPVEAQFYKLLIYDEGSFFVGHRDTEKAPGMFATLVIVLPSDGSGGELVVRHGGREARLALRVDDAAEAAYAAFYADCVHEVLPVTAGYRLTLVYNLVRPGAGKRLEPPRYESEVTRLAKLLRNWPLGDEAEPKATRQGDPATGAVELEDEELEDEEFDEDLDDEDLLDDEDDDDEEDGGVGAHGALRPEKIVYPLAHAYTPAELSFAGLKGADAAAAGVLIGAAEQAACELHLALLVIEEEGSAEYADYGRSSRRRSRYHDEDEFEVGEVYETSRTLSDWRRPDAASCALGPIPVLKAELSPPDALEDVEPDESYFHEATGNEGATFERTYRRAALVLWPRARTFAVLSQAGLAVTLPALADMVRRSKHEGGEPAAAQRQAASDLAGHMIASWPRHPTQPRSAEAAYPANFLGLLGDLGDVDLVRRFLAEVATGRACGQDDNPAILGALRRLPKQDRVGMLTRIVAARAKLGFAGCADLLVHAARGSAPRPRDLAEAAAALVADLPGDPATAEWGRTPSVEPGFVADLMTALPAIDEAQAARVVDHILRWPKTYDFDNVIVPGLCKLAAADKAGPSPSLERLRATALAHLDARIAQPLAKPTDWRRAAELGCGCKDCTAVASFLADPTQQTWMLKAAQYARTHVEDVVRRAGADVGATTERKGSPHILVLTKNQASYARRARQRDNDLSNRAALGGS